MTAYVFYQLCVVRKNRFSQQKEFKVLNKFFEVNVLGKLISNRIKKAHVNVIYKQETEEVKEIRECLQTVIQANGLESHLPFLQVKLLHNTRTISMFMSLD